MVVLEQTKQPTQLTTHPEKRSLVAATKRREQRMRNTTNLCTCFLCDPFIIAQHFCMHACRVCCFSRNGIARFVHLPDTFHHHFTKLEMFFTVDLLSSLISVFLSRSPSQEGKKLGGDMGRKSYWKTFLSVVLFGLFFSSTGLCSLLFFCKKSVPLIFVTFLTSAVS